MSDGTLGRGPVGGKEDLPGFFGAEPLEPLEQVAPEVRALIDDHLVQAAGGRERLIPLLHRIQESLGHLPFAVQEYVAGKLGLSPIQVYGVVSFYRFFTTTPRGKHELKICMGTACFVRQSRRLAETLEQTLGVGVGEVTEDGLFSVEEVRCLGACGLAPAMMHNNVTHGNLSPKELRRMLSRLKTAARGEKKPEPPETSSE